MFIENMLQTTQTVKFKCTMTKWPVETTNIVGNLNVNLENFQQKTFYRKIVKR